MLTSDASIVKTPATEFVPSELRRPVYECETAPSASMLSLEKPVVDQDPVMFGAPNITGGFTLDVVSVGRFGIADVQGAFTASDPYEMRFDAGASKGNQYTRAEFSAASSHAIYSGSSSVQPSSMLMLPCIKT